MYVYICICICIYTYTLWRCSYSMYAHTLTCDAFIVSVHTDVCNESYKAIYTHICMYAHRLIPCNYVCTHTLMRRMHAQTYMMHSTSLYMHISMSMRVHIDVCLCGHTLMGFYTYRHTQTYVMCCIWHDTLHMTWQLFDSPLELQL